MRPAQRATPGLPAWILAACMLQGCAGARPPGHPAADVGDAADVKVLFPPDRAVLLCGEFHVLCRAPRAALIVDGRPQAWEAFQPPLHACRLKLDPGRHKLRIGPRQVEVFVADTPASPKGPTGWGVYRSHPIAGRGPQACAACHECDQRGRLTAVGELKPHTACFACHREVDFDVAHDAHPLQPLEACHMCHALHGSAREKLLKDATRKLCADCHDT